jgi:chemotaxis-related protein WspD
MNALIKDCWNTIGVHGDTSCSALEAHVHCRNCPVYSSAAAHLLDGEPPPGYVQDWTEQARRGKGAAERHALSVVLFRLGAEWLALPTGVLTEIASPRPIHSLPHRRSNVVLGLANVRGALLACVSLRDLLGVEGAGAAHLDPTRRIAARFLVLQRDGLRAVCPVDEVHGIERFLERHLGPAPATVAGADSRFTRALLPWQQRSVGLLDEQPLFRAIERTLA